MKICGRSLIEQARECAIEIHRAPATRADLAAAEQWVEHLRRLMGELTNMDTRPFVLTGESTERIGPDPVLAVLRAMYSDAYQQLAEIREDLAVRRTE